MLLDFQRVNLFATELAFCSGVNHNIARSSFHFPKMDSLDKKKSRKKVKKSVAELNKASSVSAASSSSGQKSKGEQAGEE